MEGIKGELYCGSIDSNFLCNNLLMRWASPRPGKRCMTSGFTNINTTLEAFVIKQNGHNQRLEKILEKLAKK